MQEKEKRKIVPHLWNMNEDPALSCVIAYFIDKDEITVGNGRSDEEPDIVLKGLSIAPKHAIIRKTDGKIFIKRASPRSKILVNGKELEYVIATTDTICFFFLSSSFRLQIFLDN